MWTPAKRVARKRRLVRKKAQLFALLGDSCAICGSTQELSVDHIDGREWGVAAREVSQETRINLYLLEAANGVRLRTLCKKHNSGYRAYRSVA